MITKCYFFLSAFTYSCAGWFSSEDKTAVTIFLLFNSVFFFIIGIINIFLEEAFKDEYRD